MLAEVAAINATVIRRSGCLRTMLWLDGKIGAVASVIKATRNLPEPQKAKNQPVGWFF